MTRLARRLVQFLFVAIVIAAGSSVASGAAFAQQADTTVVSPGDPSNTTVPATSANPGSVTTQPPITVPGIEQPTVSSVVADDPTDDSNIISIAAPEGASSSVTLVVLVTLVSVVPSLLLLTTTFPRFLIVLGLARQALGLNTTPPNQVLAGLAAFLTFFVMGPTFSKINDTAIQPATKGDITTSQALEAGWAPMRDFMLDRTRSSDLEMLFDMVGEERPESPAKLSPRFVIPAFILSELRAGFLIGFLIYVPFLLVDLIVSSVLAALGMMMMPPVVVSMPLKLALFVLVDGWALLASSLLKSAAVGG